MNLEYLKIEISYEDIEKYGLEKCILPLYESNHYKQNGQFKPQHIRRIKKILKNRRQVEKFGKVISRKMKFQKRKLLRIQKFELQKQKKTKIILKQEQRIKVKNASDYGEYLNSKHWMKRRAMYWRKHSRICFCCGNYADNLHHRVYELYKEKDEHFVPLCQTCHKGIHNVIKENRIKLSVAHKVYKEKYIDKIK